MSYIEARGYILAEAIKKQIGNEVFSGPFKGLKLNLICHAGNFSPFLLGTYESELHEIIEQICGGSKKYDNVLNVGCSFGYYACGLAMRMPNSIIWAMDIERSIMDACLDTANLNKLYNIVTSDDLTMAADLIVMDCEGAEDQYLTGNEKADILVELHECMYPGITQRVIDRFKDTHNVKLIDNEPSYFNLRQVFSENVQLEHFDNAIVTYEGRAGETPWAWMTLK